MHSQFFITRGNKILEMDMVIWRFDKIKKRDIMCIKVDDNILYK